MANESVLAEIDSVLAEYESVEKQFKQTTEMPGSRGATYINAPANIVARIVTLLDAAIRRLSPPCAPYSDRAEGILKPNRPQGDSNTIRYLAGVLQALRADYERDRIRTFQELVHSELFADLLEAAAYLLDESYKDPAAVMAGGVLEQHLRELCRKHGLDTTSINSKGETKSKMLDALNADLAKALAYGKIEQKDVTAWAGLRNAAAHGQYGDYDANQVGQMIAGIRGFISRHPA